MDDTRSSRMDSSTVHCVEQLTIFAVPEQGVRTLFIDGVDALLGVGYMGVVSMQASRVVWEFLGPPHLLGYLNGLARAVVDRLDQRTQAAYIHHDETGCARGRGGNRKQLRDLQ